MKLLLLGYRKLLWLYPRSFREEFGEEMASFFEERLRDASFRGRAACALACAEAMSDLCASAWAERRDAKWGARSRRRTRTGRRAGMLNGIVSDARSALRAMRKRPVLSASAVMTLALGLGAASVVFAAVNAVLLRPLPYVEPERIVTIWNRYGAERVYSSPPDYLDRRERTTAFERLAAVAPTTMNLSGAIEPRHVDVAKITAEFFDVFGVRDQDGTPLRFPDETGAEGARVAVLAHGLWQSGFGGEPVRGKKIALNGQPYEIVGVLPRGFDFPRGVSVYVPLVFAPEEIGDDNRGNEFLLNLGRLRPGVPLQTARSEVETVAAGVLERVPERRPFLERNDWGAAVVPLHELLTENVRPALVLLGAAVLLVLVVSAANVANMSLASLSGRARELAVRSTLGASRGRVIRQLVVENLILSFTGALGGLALSALVLAALPLALARDVPGLQGTHLDLWVLAFTVLAAALMGVVSGIVPAWQAASGRLLGALRAETLGTGSRLRRGLVVLEVTLAVALLAGAGLLVRSFEALTELDPGFSANRRLTFRLRLPASQYPDPEDRIAFETELLERLRAIPGVRSVAASDRIPLDGTGWTGSFHPVGYEVRPGEATPGGDFNRVSPGYFETLGIPLLQGRDFADADTRDTTPVVIVDAWAAERFWPGGAVGQRIDMNRSDGPPSFREIVGVVGHVKTGALDERGRLQVYFPSTQTGGRRLCFTLHADGSPTETVGRARDEVARLAPALPIYSVQTLEELVADSLAFRELQMGLLSAFAVLTLLLAAVGLYGVLSYSVSRRRVEIGVRLAMGAGGRSIVGLVLGDACLLVFLGVGGGLALSVSVSRLFEQLIFGIRPADPATFLVVVLLVVSLSAIAAGIPARRASRVDPIEALRG